MSRDTLLNNISDWKALFENVTPLVDYASTSQPEVLDILKDNGAHFYFNEKTYFDQVVDKVNTSNLCVTDFSGNLLDSYLSSLEKSVISSVVVDSKDSLLRCVKHNSQLSFVVRLSVSGGISEPGCTKEEMEELFSTVKEMAIPLSALTIDCANKEKVSSCITQLEAATELANNHGISISKIYMTGEGVQQLVGCSDAVSQASLTQLRTLSQHFTVYLDASRFFTANIYTIYSLIIGKKVKVVKNQETGAEKTIILYYTDNGVYCSFYNTHIYEEAIHPIPVSAHGIDYSNAPLFESTIFGPTCDSIDCLGNKFSLPDMEIGEWIKYENNGYKCCNYSARFNGFEDPDIIVVYLCLFLDIVYILFK